MIAFQQQIHLKNTFLNPKSYKGELKQLKMQDMICSDQIKCVRNRIY